MEALLLDPVADADERSAMSGLITQFRQDVAAVRAEVDGLRRENLELRQQAGYWKGMHAQAVRRLAALEQEVEQLRGEKRQLQAQAFGHQSERSPSRDRSNHLEGETDPTPARQPRGQRRGQPGPQRRDYSHLPVTTEERRLPPEQQVCPTCGLALTPSDTEDSEQVEIDVRAYRRRICRRRYQRTCSCRAGPRTVTAPPAPKLIPKGLLGVSVWVEILLDKYASYRPTERLLEHWQLLDFAVAAGTVAGGLQRLEPLFTPLYDAVLARNAQAPFAHGDETRWSVFIEQEGKCGHRWWLWVVVSADTVAFRLDPSRSHTVPEGHFAADASLVFMVDRYAAYKAMAQVQAGTIILVFCWAHVRRDFVTVGKGWEELKPWALAWLRRIRELYQQQRQRRTAGAGAAAFQAADAAVRHTVAAMQAQAATELADPELRQPCRKVLLSLQEHWSGLTRFVDDLRIPLDNNAAERQNRGPAVARKNYYGSGALWSGRLAAMLFTLFATVRLGHLNVRKWLTWFLQSCADNGGRAPADISPFLPWELSAEQRTALTLEGSPSSPDSS
jgi:transposase